MLPPFGLASWMAATAGHFVLTAWWIRQLDSSSQSRDERWFQTTLAGVGGLSLVIHLLTATVGLSLARGIAALVVYHALVAMAVGVRRRAAQVPRQTDDPASRVERILEACSSVVLTGIVIAWMLDTSSSVFITGSDATHYHVPVAVNLALGGHLFDLPATQHLYPMAASALAAWLILPVDGPLFVDLTMLLPFMLLAASTAWLFRLATGRSGLAWTPWLLLVLFSLRLFRVASHMSADLLFAAAFVALTAQLVAMITAGRTRTIDFVLLGFAGGLLVGAKTTGIPAAALLIVGALAAYPIARNTELSSERRLHVPQAAAGLAVAFVVALGAGGVWLIRNWWLFGSPIAPTGLSILGVEIFAGPPHEPTTYLSVLGDFQDPGYPFGQRLAHYTATWLGSWYLVLLLPALLVPVDLIVSRIRRLPDPGWLRKLVVWLLVLATGAALGSLLIGAPWTSLERTAGLSLRYMLPFALLLPCLAIVGIFSSNVPWYRNELIAAGAGTALVAVGLGALWMVQGGGFAPPRLRLWPLVTSAALWLISYLLVARRPSWLRGSSGLAATMAVVLAASIVWASDSHDRGERAYASESRRQARADRRPAAARAIYLAALESEQKLFRDCQSRRFFSLTRVDAPLELQPLNYRNRVYYAGRDFETTARVEPLTPCDYIIASRGQHKGPKGQALVDVLSGQGRTVEIAERAQFVLLGRE